MVHYLLATLRYMEGSFTTNDYWFMAGVVLCGPLGLLGWSARRRDWRGVLAALVVPCGAIAEPWVLGVFSPWPEIPWSERYSDMACGWVLTTAGAVGVLMILTWRHPRRHQGQWLRA